MLSKHDQSSLRADIFRHLDGIVTAPIAFAIYKGQITQILLDQKSINSSDLARLSNANEGYLNVALRVLASQGWLVQSINIEENVITYSCNEKSKIAFSLFHLYEDIVNLMSVSGAHHPRKFSIEAFDVMDKVCDKVMNNFGLSISNDPLEEEVQFQILKHIEGALIGPTIVHLGMGGMFHKYFMEASFRADEYHENPESFFKLLSFFTYLGWFKQKNDTFQFTDRGLFFARRASSYGVTVSYLPMFRQIQDFLFGDSKKIRELSNGEDEKHVDRAMNVWGSGGAHATYFKKIDEIVIELFNKPIEQQPKGILDMGCGNGAFIQHLFEVIEQRTERGKILDEHPLFLVGADYNEAALKITRANLIKADIWAKVVWGDIGRPDVLANDLNENYGIDLSSLLNVRTFLDHNRIWEAPSKKTAGRKSLSTGAFAFGGERLSNNDVEDNLLDHFKKWAPYVERFGLLVIELHTISPEITSKNLGVTPATAYDATHGFSDQYIVEPDVFLKVAAEAGLFPDNRFSHKFPDSELATVTINLLRGE